MSENTVKHNFSVKKENRQSLNGHNSFVVWFTGLSGSGKSTISNIVEQKLHELGVRTYVLDGDNVRKGLNNDLKFNEDDRSENIRRIAEVAHLFLDAGVVVLSAFISPLEKDRQMAKDVVKAENFIEVYINTSLDECERRDVKGLYKKARAGEITDFTGISAPYEAPKNPDLEIKTGNLSVEDAASEIVKLLKTKLKMS